MYDIALRRFVWLAGGGCVVVLGYAYSIGREQFLAGSAAGLMSAGASLLLGGLVGFLFGVPRVQSSGDPSAKRASGDTQEASLDASKGIEFRYHPSSSLEQIAEWLTKMLIGVGLIDFRDIGKQVWGFSEIVNRAMGGKPETVGFALVLQMYFFICGFFFGFLWARLYLVQWYREVDQVRALKQQLDKIEQQQLTDGKVMSLINQRLNSSEDTPELTDRQLTDAVKSASIHLKGELFVRAKQMSEERREIHVAIALLRGLVEADRGKRYFENRAELSYALTRQKPEQFEEAEELLSQAIDIRDHQGRRGWRYYEMRRAWYRINLDGKVSSAKESDRESASRIVSDLRVAQTSEKWPNWLADLPIVRDWLRVNRIDPQSLDRT